MQQRQPTTAKSNPGAPADLATRLAAIEEQGRQTFELVRTMVGLLLPKEGGQEDVSLENLIAGMVAMQRDLMIVARATQTEVRQLGETLPPAVAEAIQDGRMPARNS